MSEHPIRLVISDDLSRKRLTVFFRGLLVIPHYVWLGIWGIGALFAGFANWIATLFMGRSPAPLHRFLAGYVKYATQVYAYLLLAADPYPRFDGRPGYPVDAEIEPPEQQSRFSVAFRLLLVLPALLLAAALFGAPQYGRSETFEYSLGVAHAAAILGWFASLALRRMPRGLRDSVAWGIGYSAQLWAYLFVLTSRYPDSDPQTTLGELPVRRDPVDVRLSDDLRRSRLTTFFRLPLAFPHLVWLTLWGIAAYLVAVVNWLITLVRGRPPQLLHRFLAAFVRYGAHVYAFLSLTTNPFPGFVGSVGSYPLEVTVAPADRQIRWTVAFRLLLAVPAWILVFAYGSLLFPAAVLAWFAVLITGSMPRRLRNTEVQALRYAIQTNGYVLLLTDAYPYGGPCQVSDAPAGAGARTAV